MIIDEVVGYFDSRFLHRLIFEWVSLCYPLSPTSEGNRELGRECARLRIEWYVNL